MKANGSLYVSVVLAALAAYFGYQAWFNPRRAITRQLGELAATLSVPPDARSDADQRGRAVQLRRFLADDARLQLGPAGPLFASGDAIVQAFGLWTPPTAGLDVEFVDVQVALDSTTDARAFMTVDLVGRDERTGELSRTAREVRLFLRKRDGVWVITRAEAAAPTR
jgi:hypothetical protein